MDSKIYYRWPTFNVSELIQDMPSKALIIAPEEYEVMPNWNHHPEFNQLHDIDLTILFGSANLEYHYAIRHQYPKNAKVILWPTYWMTYTYHRCKDLTIEHKPIDKLFLSLNNKGHYHRCFMFDELYKNGLFEHSALSMHDPNWSSYLWKYWTPTKLTLDKHYEENLDSWKAIPDEFSNTLISLIAESNLDTVFITEKTAMAILFSRPFIVFGAFGFHRTLKNLGFELYDEIFDYSFDEEFRSSDRLQGLIENLKRLAGQDYNSIRSKLAEKIEYNKNHMIKISTSRKYVPKEMLDHLENLKINNDSSLQAAGYLNLEKNFID